MAVLYAAIAAFIFIRSIIISSLPWLVCLNAMIEGIDRLVNIAAVVSADGIPRVVLPPHDKRVVRIGVALKGNDDIAIGP
tara:strand:+ start:1271 stop:1510 length:240 start_codon:yes stop_codon:yes gene_type:complete